MVHFYIYIWCTNLYQVPLYPHTNDTRGLCWNLVAVAVEEVPTRSSPPTPTPVSTPLCIARWARIPFISLINRIPRSTHLILPSPPPKASFNSRWTSVEREPFYLEKSLPPPKVQPPPIKPAPPPILRSCHPLVLLLPPHSLEMIRGIVFPMVSLLSHNRACPWSYPPVLWKNTQSFISVLGKFPKRAELPQIWLFSRMRTISWKEGSREGGRWEDGTFHWTSLTRPRHFAACQQICDMPLQKETQCCNIDSRGFSCQKYFFGRQRRDFVWYSIEEQNMVILQ